MVTVTREEVVAHANPDSPAPGSTYRNRNNYERHPTADTDLRILRMKVRTQNTTRGRERERERQQNILEKEGKRRKKRRENPFLKKIKRA